MVEVSEKVKKRVKYGHLGAHSSYLLFAGLEGHGLYSVAALALLAIVWIGVALGVGEELA